MSITFAEANLAISAQTPGISQLPNRMMIEISTPYLEDPRFAKRARFNAGWNSLHGRIANRLYPKV